MKRKINYQKVTLIATIVFSVLAVITIGMAIYTHITYGYVLLQ